MQKYFRETGYLFICLLLVAILLLAFLWALSIGTVKIAVGTDLHRYSRSAAKRSVC